MASDKSELLLIYFAGLSFLLMKLVSASSSIAKLNASIRAAFILTDSNKSTFVTALLKFLSRSAKLFLVTTNPFFCRIFNSL